MYSENEGNYQTIKTKQGHKIIFKKEINEHDSLEAMNKNLYTYEVNIDGIDKSFKDLKYEDVRKLGYYDRLSYEIWKNHELENLIYKLNLRILKLEDKVNQYENSDKQFKCTVIKD